jgi:hypothetical protein
MADHRISPDLISGQNRTDLHADLTNLFSNEVLSIQAQ